MAAVSTQLSATQSDSMAVPRLIQINGTVRGPETYAEGGVVGITFAFYEEKEGGASLWMETQNVVLEENGRYRVFLGSDSAEGLPPEIFISGKAKWLGISIENQAEGERIPVATAPYAIRAYEADRLAGRSIEEFVLVKNDSQLEGVSQQFLAIEPVDSLSATKGEGTGANSVRFADGFTGHDAGAKISNCIADLPATGGTCDARGLEGAQSITSTVSFDKPVMLLLGAANFACTATPCFNVGDTVRVQILGMGWFDEPSGQALGGSVLSKTNPGAIISGTEVKQVVLSDLVLDGGAKATFGVDLNGVLWVTLQRLSIGNLAVATSPAVRLRSAGSTGNYGGQHAYLEMVNGRRYAIVVNGTGNRFTTISMNTVSATSYDFDVVGNITLVNATGENATMGASDAMFDFNDVTDVVMLGNDIEAAGAAGAKAVNLTSVKNFFMGGADFSGTTLAAADRVSGTADETHFQQGRAIETKVKDTSSAGIQLLSPVAIGTSPATTGQVRLPNAQTIAARTFDNTTNLNLLTLDVNDQVVLGHSTAVPVALQGSNIVLNPGSGSVRPDPAGLDLGTSSARWDLFADVVDVATRFDPPASTTLPGTCTANRSLFVDSGATPAGQQLYLCNSSGNGWNLVGDGGGANIGYATVEDEGAPLPQRATLNLAGPGVSCADDTTKTTCTISDGGSGGTPRTGQFEYFFFEQKSDLSASLDVPGVHINRSRAITITEVYCEVDNQWASINLQRSAGDSSSILQSDLTCWPSGGVSSDFVLEGDKLAVGDRLDHVTASIGRGVRRLTVVVSFTVD